MGTVVDRDDPVYLYLELALAINKMVGEKTGVEPLLSKNTYNYGISVPTWSWEEVGRKVEEAEKAISELPSKRADYIGDMLKSFAVMARDGMGEEISYGEQVNAYHQIPGERVKPEIFDLLGNELEGLLSEAGYPKDIAVAIPQWKKDQSIEGEDLIRQSQEYLEKARQRTAERVIDLPPDHHVRLKFAQKFPYHGYSYYSRGYSGHVILFDDIEWVVPDLKHIICHEAFPGHQAYYAMREWKYRNGEFPVEGTVYLCNTAVTPIAEGMCEIGQDALGMVESIDDQIFDVYNRFCSASNANLAFDANEDDVDRETCILKIMKSNFISRVFAEKRYEFFTHKLWRTSFPHYWYGREFMRDNFAKMQGHLSAFYRMVFTEEHTMRTLGEAIERYLGDKVS